MIQRRELPAWLGSSPMPPWNFVASTTLSRRPSPSAFPTISSDSPREYTSAVSMKLMPASSARWMIRIESSWSVLPQAPNIIAPRHRGLTLTPVVPSVRCSTGRRLPGRRGRLPLCALVGGWDRGLDRHREPGRLAPAAERRLLLEPPVVGLGERGASHGGLRGEHARAAFLGEL